MRRLFKLNAIVTISHRPHTGLGPRFRRNVDAPVDAIAHSMALAAQPTGLSRVDRISSR